MPQANPPVLYKPAQPLAYTPAPAPAPPTPSRRPTSTRAATASPTKMAANGHTPFYPDLSARDMDARPLSNPLPAPPRESIYKPRAAAAAVALAPAVDPDAPRSREYWAKYAGLTAS
jgi:hypothetical protein